ncbi:MAG: AfsR/SARP family transcriptional regulator [Thiotrichales bacterium]
MLKDSPDLVSADNPNTPHIQDPLLDEKTVSSLLKLVRDIDPGTQEIDPLSSKFLAHEISDTAEISLQSLLSEQKHRRLADEAGTKARHLLAHLLSLLQILQKQLSVVSSRDLDECMHPIQGDIEKLLNDIPPLLSIDNNTDNGKLADLPPSAENNHLNQSPPLSSKQANTFSPDSDEIRIKTFGGFTISVDGDTVSEFKNAKGRQLLKYLLVNRHRIVLKEELMELLWPNHDEFSARNNLNVVVYSVRHAMRDYIGNTKFVLFSNGGYQINPQLRISTDFDEFSALTDKAQRDSENGEVAIATPELERAEELYQGCFLPEDLYADWTLALREKYRENYINLLFSLDSAYQTFDEPNKRIEINKRILEIDECNEIAHLNLMKIYDQTCQRHLALKQFKLAKAVLSKELGVGPNKQLESLYNLIGAHPSCATQGIEQR